MLGGKQLRFQTVKTTLAVYARLLPDTNLQILTNSLIILKTKDGYTATHS